MEALFENGASSGPRAAGVGIVQSFLLSCVLLGILVAVGVAVIVKIRSWWQVGSDDHGDWENALVEYKNLRDRGLLSDEEYRKIKTLVEPHVQSLPMAPSHAAVSAIERADRNEPSPASEEQD